jgi:hypothetical protein
MTKASTELGQREIRSAASFSPGKPRRGRPSIPIAAEDLLEMAALVFDASHGTRGHYSAAGLVIARRYPQVGPQAHQARRKLMVRRFLGRKAQLLAEVKARRKPKQQAVYVSSHSPLALSPDLEEAVRSHSAGIERIKRLADQCRVQLPAWCGTAGLDRLATELNLYPVGLGRQGVHPHGDDPGRSILQNAARGCGDPLLAALASGRSIAASMGQLRLKGFTSEFDQAFGRWQVGDDALHGSDPLSRWTKFR